MPDWTGEKHVRFDNGCVRLTATATLVGNAAKAERVLGWTPRVTTERLVRIMVDANNTLENEGRPWIDVPET